MNDINIVPGSRCFVDTNIWLYAFIHAEDQKKYEKAKTGISANEIILSTQVINEICVNLLKKAGFSELRINPLIASPYKRYTVLEFSQDILLKASEIRAQFSFSFWDSLIAASALDSEADLLISEDMQHGFKLTENLSIFNPFF